MSQFRLRLTKPDIIAFLFWAILGGLISSDENNNVLLNMWHGLILGAIFLGLFKWFKSGVFK